jgi:hypothetical protein
MDTILINRYQRGGDIYQSLAATYGAANADNIAAAALTGDEAQVNAAIVAAKYGAPLDTSTTHAFVDQVATDPLAAPLAGLNNVVGNTFLSFLKSPWVLLALVITAFFLLGGADFLKRKLAKA